MSSRRRCKEFVAHAFVKSKCRECGKPEAAHSLDAPSPTPSTDGSSESAPTTPQHAHAFDSLDVGSLSAGSVLNAGCTHYTPHAWIFDRCRECGRTEGVHETSDVGGDQPEDQSVAARPGMKVRALSITQRPGAKRVAVPRSAGAASATIASTPQSQSQMQEADADASTPHNAASSSSADDATADVAHSKAEQDMQDAVAKMVLFEKEYERLQARDEEKLAAGSMTRDQYERSMEALREAFAKKEAEMRVEIEAARKALEEATAAREKEIEEAAARAIAQAQEEARVAVEDAHSRSRETLQAAEREKEEAMRLVAEAQQVRAQAEASVEAERAALQAEKQQLEREREVVAAARSPASQQVAAPTPLDGGDDGEGEEQPAEPSPMLPPTHVARDGTVQLSEVLRNVERLFQQGRNVVRFRADRAPTFSAVFIRELEMEAPAAPAEAPAARESAEAQANDAAEQPQDANAQEASAEETPAEQQQDDQQPEQQPQPEEQSQAEEQPQPQQPATPRPSQYYLCWTRANDRTVHPTRTLALRDISAVVIGKQSSVMRQECASRVDSRCCVSFIANTSCGKKSLHLQFGNARDADTWAYGIGSLMKEFGMKPAVYEDGQYSEQEAERARDFAPDGSMPGLETEVDDGAKEANQKDVDSIASCVQPNRYRIELSCRAQNLPSVHRSSIICLVDRNERTNKLEYLSQTEKVSGTECPNFKKRFGLVFADQSAKTLRFNVYDIPAGSKTLEDSYRLGSAVVSIQALVDRPGAEFVYTLSHRHPRRQKRLSEAMATLGVSCVSKTLIVAEEEEERAARAQRVEHERLMQKGDTFTNHVEGMEPQGVTLYYTPGGATAAPNGNSISPASATSATNTNASSDRFELGSLHWASMGTKPQSVSLRSIVDVFVGRKHRAFAPSASDETCFSLVTRSGVRLDLEAKSKQLRDAWVGAIIALLKAAAEQQQRDKAKATTTMPVSTTPVSKTTEECKPQPQQQIETGQSQQAYSPASSSPPAGVVAAAPEEPPMVEAVPVAAN